MQRDRSQRAHSGELETLPGNSPPQASKEYEWCPYLSPVSLTLNLCKPLERMVLGWIARALETNSLLGLRQPGLWSHLHAQDNIAFIHHDITRPPTSKKPKFWFRLMSEGVRLCFSRHGSPRHGKKKLRRLHSKLSSKSRAGGRVPKLD